MADVFVSYSRQDKARAARLVERLEAEGWDVFWDQETRVGTLWPKVLEDELGRARCLIVLWTANSCASRWVRIEAYEGLQTDKLFPVRLEEVKPPMEFRQTQTFDLIGWDGKRDDPRLQQLFADLGAMAGAPPGRRANGLPASEADRRADHAGNHEAAAGSASREAARAAPPLVASGTQEPVVLPRAEPAPAEPGWSAAEASSRQRRSFAVAAAIVGLIATAGYIALNRQVEQRPAEPTPQVVAPMPEKQPPPVAVEAAPAAPTTRPLSTSTATTSPPVAKQARAAPARCIEIAEKYQTTGQLTEEERRFLGSKECAR